LLFIAGHGVLKLNLAFGHAEIDLVWAVGIVVDRPFRGALVDSIDIFPSIFGAGLFSDEFTGEGWFCGRVIMNLGRDLDFSVGACVGPDFKGYLFFLHS
jgi:hypothetical protein